MSGSLSNSPAEIVRALLVSLSKGVLPSVGGSWPIYVGNEPDTPDVCMTIYNTQGRDIARTHFQGSRVEYHGFQVRLRSSTEREGYLKARDICVSLDEQSTEVTVSVQVSSYLILSISRSSDVLPLGKQTPSNKLDLFTINGTLSVRQLS